MAGPRSITVKQVIEVTAVDETPAIDTTHSNEAQPVNPVVMSRNQLSIRQIAVITTVIAVVALILYVAL